MTWTYLKYLETVTKVSCSITIEPSTKLRGTSPASTDEHQSIKVIPAEDLSWPNVKDDPGVQERETASICATILHTVLVSVAYPSYPTNNYVHLYKHDNST